jgi:hypothetical protein
MMSDTIATNNKLNWLKILQVILQAAISALTAIGVTSCTVTH